MSVLKNKRSVSSLEFYHNAIMLRREITMLLLRDFGIKDKVRSVKSLYGVPGMEPEDEQKFREIVEKYEMKATIIEEYPAWLIDKMRNNIMNILHNMIMNITQANTIYPVYNVVKSMDKLFDELFIHPFIGGGHRDEQNNNEQK